MKTPIMDDIDAARADARSKARETAVKLARRLERDALREYCESTHRRGERGNGMALAARAILVAFPEVES